MIKVSPSYMEVYECESGLVVNQCLFMSNITYFLKIQLMLNLSNRL